jgi:hypothetical protein
MNWKNILKVDMKEARRLGRKYAGKEMMQDDTEKLVRREKLAIDSMRTLIPKIRDNESNFNILTSDELQMIRNQLDRTSNPPSIDSRVGREDVIRTLEKYISRLETTHKKFGY